MTYKNSFKEKSEFEIEAFVIRYKNNSQIFFVTKCQTRIKSEKERSLNAKMFSKNDSGHPVDQWINLFPSPIHHEPKWNTIRAARGKSQKNLSEKSIFTHDSLLDS